MQDFALPFSAECLKSITGLTNMRYQDMNAWSQGMIDGIANYVGDSAVEARCHAATAGIDAAIDDMLPVLSKHADKSLLGVMVASGMPMASVRANIKLAISGGQNEPRDAIAGTVWALLTHPEQLELVRSGKIRWLQAFEEYARWISPIGMSPRRIAKPWTIRDVAFEANDRVFLCSDAPIATRSISRTPTALMFVATRQRASLSARDLTFAQARGLRARWWRMSRFRPLSRGSRTFGLQTIRPYASAAGPSAVCSIFRSNGTTYCRPIRKARTEPARRGEKKEPGMLCRA